MGALPHGDDSLDQLLRPLIPGREQVVTDHVAPAGQPGRQCAPGLPLVRIERVLEAWSLAKSEWPRVAA